MNETYPRWQRGDREYAILEALANELVSIGRAVELFCEGGEPPLVEHEPLLPGWQDPRIVTAPSHVLRKLAVAWKCADCGFVFDLEEHDGSGSHARQTGPSTYEQCDPVNALCDASALPELSGLLGELAVKTAALERISNAECDGDMDVGCINFNPATVRYCSACEAQAALSSDSGRLAAELIRAAVKQLLLFDRLETAQSEEEASELGQQCNEASEQEVQACFALLAAFPSLREEVERG